MTTPIQTTPTPEIGPDGAGLDALAAQVTETAAARLSLTPAQVERAMALSAWTTAAEMIERDHHRIAHVLADNAGAARQGGYETNFYLFRLGRERLRPR